MYDEGAGRKEGRKEPHATLALVQLVRHIHSIRQRQVEQDRRFNVAEDFGPSVG